MNLHINYYTWNFSLHIYELYFYVRIFSISSVAQCVQLFVTPWTAASQAYLSITNSWSLLKPMSIESVLSSNHLILCHPLLLQPSIFPSIRVFSNELALRIWWPKYWSFSLGISPSSEYWGFLFSRIDWFDLLAENSLKRSKRKYSGKNSWWIEIKL